MIGTVVICPSAPFLLARYAGRQPVGAEVRAACRTALAAALAPAAGTERVVVLTGVTRDPRNTLPPLGFRVAAELLAEAGWTGPVEEVPVDADADPDACAWIGSGLDGDGQDRTLLLVVADGSATRGEKAPGHLDARGPALDERFVAAVTAADRAGLAALDAATARDVWFGGRAALHVLAAVPGLEECRSRVLYAGDPFGVQYVVAEWTCSI